MKLTAERVKQANAANIEQHEHDPEAEGNMTQVLDAWETEREDFWCAAPHCKARHNFRLSVAVVLREGTNIPLPMIALEEAQRMDDESDPIGVMVGSFANTIITKDALAEMIADMQAAFEALP